MIKLIFRSSLMHFGQNERYLANLLPPVLNAQKKISFRTACSMESVIAEVMRTNPLSSVKCLKSLLPCRWDHNEGFSVSIPEYLTRAHPLTFICMTQWRGNTAYMEKVRFLKRTLERWFKNDIILEVLIIPKKCFSVRNIVSESSWIF